MKRGMFVMHLEIDPAQPLIFQIKTPPGASLVTAIGLVRRSKVQAPNVAPKLAPCLVWDADMDCDQSQYVDRALVLLPPEGWVGEAGAVCLGHFVSMIDGCPFLIYEVPFRATEEVDADDREMPGVTRSARPIIDVPTEPLSPDGIAPLNDDDLPDPSELH